MVQPASLHITNLISQDPQPVNYRSRHLISHVTHISFYSPLITSHFPNLNNLDILLLFAGDEAEPFHLIDILCLTYGFLQFTSLPWPMSCFSLYVLIKLLIQTAHCDSKMWQ